MCSANTLENMEGARQVSPMFVNNVVDINPENRQRTSRRLFGSDDSAGDNCDIAESLAEETQRRFEEFQSRYVIIGTESPLISENTEIQNQPENINQVNQDLIPEIIHPNESENRQANNVRESEDPNQQASDPEANE